MPVAVTRLLDEPIIRPHMDERMGDNINGPSLIRVPHWVEGRLGRYYLYFAYHKGSYIRLAYADALTGPWTLHAPGVLDVKDSLFEPVDPPEPPEADRPPWAERLKGGYLYAHVASPDVHVDHGNRRIRMYYHGLLWNGDQQTRLATSLDGVTFEPLEPLLGPAYFRAFEYAGYIHALVGSRVIWRARRWEGPFERGPNIIASAGGGGIDNGCRHGAVHRVADRLHVFYTRKGERPEGILHAVVDLTRHWTDWVARDPVTVLEPELDWEGADLPLETSIMGAADRRVRELRDPGVFEDAAGEKYLLYCGAGESGIGLAAISGL